MKTIKHLAFGAAAAFLFSGVGQLSAATYTLDPGDPNYQFVEINSATYGYSLYSTDFTAVASSEGTGNLDPFLRIQANSTEQGYNTDLQGAFDEKAGIWTHNIQIGDLPTQNGGPGEAFYVFLLDINESTTAKNAWISLDEFRIYTAATPPVDPNNANKANPDLTQIGTLRYSLEGNTILYNDLNSGSGQGDIGILIEQSLFAGLGPETYVMVYMKFGGAPSDNPQIAYESDAGFEELNLAAIQVFVPEATALLPMLALVGTLLGSRSLRIRPRALAAA